MGARRAPTPLDPIAADVENHRLTGQSVFISWCRHCVPGRGREAAHSSIERPEGSLPFFSFDYCYLSSKHQAPEGEHVPPGPLESPALVMFDSKGKGIHARLMPANGVDFEGPERTLKLWAGDLDRFGYKRIAFGSDTEVFITSLLRELRNHWSGEVFLEKAATSRSCGAAAQGPCAHPEGRPRAQPW